MEEKFYQLVRWPEDFEDVVNEIIEKIEADMFCNPISLEHIEDILREVMKYYRGHINPKKAKEIINLIVTNRILSYTKPNIIKIANTVTQ